MELAACLFEIGFDLPGEMLKKGKIAFPEDFFNAFATHLGFVSYSL